MVELNMYTIEIISIECYFLFVKKKIPVLTHPLYSRGFFLLLCNPVTIFQNENCKKRKEIKKKDPTSFKSMN